MHLSASLTATGIDRHAAEISQRLAGLVRASVRLIPYVRSAAPLAATIWRGQWTAAEKSAAAYYESMGYEVVRLSHETSVSVGKLYEMAVPGATQLAHAMHRILPATVMKTWLSQSSNLEKARSLTELDPRDYPVSGYPPDFLCARQGEWRFVEVKGPRDSIHFKQANWLVHRRDQAWPCEVCMPVQGLTEHRFVPDEVGPGPAFASAYREQLEDAQDYLTMMSMNGLSGTALAAAEDRNAASIVRFRRRLWAGLLAKGHDPNTLSILRSGRSMCVLDPKWPPEITEADKVRITNTAAKQAENKKRIAAYNREAKRSQR